MEASESQAKRRGAPLKNPEEKKTAQEGYYRDYAREYYRKSFCRSIECPNCGKFVNAQKLFYCTASLDLYKVVLAKNKRFLSMNCA